MRRFPTAAILELLKTGGVSGSSTGTDAVGVTGRCDTKTAVLISHRYSSVSMADRILLLHDGRVEA